MPRGNFVLSRTCTAPAGALALPTAARPPSNTTSFRLSATPNGAARDNHAFQCERRRRPAARVPSSVSTRDAVARATAAVAAGVVEDGEALLAAVDAAANPASAAELAARLTPTARDVALLWASYTGRRTVVAALLAAGADPRFMPSDNRCFGALHLAAVGGHPRACELLLAAGADVLATQRGYSALDFAVLGRSAEATGVLTARGASQTACNAALALAVQTDVLPCVEVLLPLCAGDCAINATAADDYSLLHLAAEAGNTRCVRALLAAPGFPTALEACTHDRGETPLHLAARGGFGACVAALLAKGASTAARNQRGQTPLHLAAQARSAGCVRALLAVAGCDPDARDADERTPLHYLRTLQSPEVVHLLLEHGAEASARDRYGYTPLHVAAHNELTASASALLVAGADVTSRTVGGTCAVAVLLRKAPTALKALYARLDAAVTLHDSSSTIVDSASGEVGGGGGGGPDTLGVLSGSDDAVVSLNFRPLLEHSHPGEIAYLKAFVDEGHKDILKHPLCQAFLHYKWQQVRKFYLVKMVFYMAFVLCLTVYVISSGTFHYDKRRKLLRSNPTQNCSEPNHSLCKDPTAFAQFIMKHEEIVYVSRGLFAALAVLELIRKMYGCSGYASLKEYVRHLDNVLEWVVSMSAFVLVGSSFDNDHLTHEGECFQEHLGAVTLLLAYFMLMRMVGLLPMFKCYVAMYTSVLLLFVRVLASYLCLLAGFVLAFCAAFPGLAEFANPAMGAVRTFGMMSGEILFQNTFLENQKGGLTVTSQLLFFVFVLFITVVLMNLLVGLAVNDIQGLQATADLLQLQQQTRLVSRTERALLGARLPARLRHALLRHATLSPGRYRKVFHVRPLSQRERRLPPHVLSAVYALARQPSAVAAFDGRRKSSEVAALVPTLSLPAQDTTAAASAVAVEQLITEVAELRKSVEAALQILNARGSFREDISEIA